MYAFEVGKICEENSDISKNSNADSVEIPNENQDLKFFSNGASLFDNSEEKSNESQNVNNDGSMQSPSDEKQMDDTCTKFEMPQDDSEKDSLLSFNSYKNCSICLEDYPSYELIFHPACDCVLCSNCLEVSMCLYYTFII